MEHYHLTILSALLILLSAYFAIRRRRANPWLRIAVIAASAGLVLYLWLGLGDTTQLYGLGLLAVALLFPLRDIYAGVGASEHRDNENTVGNAQK